MTKKEKIKVVAELKECVVNNVIYNKKHKYYRDTDKKIRGKYAHNFNIVCSSSKQIDFKKTIKSEITKFFKSKKIESVCSKYNRKEPTHIVITTKFMTVKGYKIDNSHYRIIIDYKY